MFINDILDRTSLIYRKYNTAIILAGGEGKRFDNEVPKQHVKIDGVPMIVHTVNAFEKCKFINEIIIVIREGEEELYTKYMTKYGWMKVTKYVTGGETRFDSVINGFKAINDKTDFVYIHDGARCLVTEKNIASVGHYACLNGCATAATLATDTVKSVEGGETKTLDRNNIWLTQTPQVFLVNEYRAAAYTAMKDGVTAFTDDCSLVERLGFKVKCVECGKENIKVTVPCDFLFAEAIIKARKAEGENE